jgi:hypothetical protein
VSGGVTKNIEDPTRKENYNPVLQIDTEDPRSKTEKAIRSSSISTKPTELPATIKSYYEMQLALYLSSQWLRKKKESS